MSFAMEILDILNNGDITTAVIRLMEQGIRDEIKSMNKGVSLKAQSALNKYVKDISKTLNRPAFRCFYEHDGLFYISNEYSIIGYYKKLEVEGLHRPKTQWEIEDCANLHESFKAILDNRLDKTVQHYSPYIMSDYKVSEIIALGKLKNKSMANDKIGLNGFVSFKNTKMMYECKQISQIIKMLGGGDITLTEYVAHIVLENKNGKAILTAHKKKEI